jgi:ATP-dependent RNA helicase RhlE
MFYKPGRSRGRKVFSSARPHSIRGFNRNQSTINPERFINKATAQAEQEVFVPIHTFNDFQISETLKKNIIDHGYLTPTPIQDVAIEPVLGGMDLIGLANTGTGKTAAFLVPILHNLRIRGARDVSCLIMVPTRELATQINEEFRAFAKGMNIYAALCVGGASINRQKSDLARRPQVVIGTPGRLKDLFNQRSLRLGSLQILVLDEADRMLDMGFIRDIRFIINQLPKNRQTLLFSATMPREIQDLVYEFQKDPLTVSVKKGETSETIEQDVIKASSTDEKIEILDNLLKQTEFDKVLIFGQTKWGVQKLADNLKSRGVTVESIHGNKSQPQRQQALQAFKNNSIQVLVATDVAARGLDIPDVSHVINFDQPNSYDDYVHRIGRTGRAGKSGKALTFVS